MSVTHLSSDVVVTRKPCKCHGCLLVYPAKTTIRKSKYIVDGDFVETCLCPTCKAFIESNPDPFAYEEGFMPGELRGNGPAAWEEIRVRIDGPTGEAKHAG